MLITKNAENNILAVPVSSVAEQLTVRIFNDSESMQLKIPAASPDEAVFTAEYPLPFKNTKIEADEKFFSFVQWKKETEIVSGRKLPNRPKYHFSASRGWLNDPNGLCFYNGIWHLFFQYNPFSTIWGNMHWAHAVSSDLMNWQELGITLFPDNSGMMYSGSAVIDKENISGLGKNTILLYYTNAHYSGGATQNIAYSTDGGKTFKKYEKNPVLGCFTGFCDRDPHVVYDHEAKIWRMALYLGDEEKKEFALLKSANLLEWTMTDRYTVPGGRECPGIALLQDLQSGKRKWVFIEANGLYRIGTIQNDRIVMETESHRFLWGTAYAGQIFHNAPAEKTIFIAWNRGSDMQQDKSYNGTMTIPMSLTLDGGKLRVAAYTGTEHMIPFAVSEKCTIQTPQGELCFDLSAHRVTFGGHIWEIPEELNVLKGNILPDLRSLEYFDDSGLFTLAFSIGEETGKLLQKKLNS